MAQDIFRMKQFNIEQTAVGMKVGTDGVLLGAWARLNNPSGQVLDIGSGTGIVSLMLAQRYANCFVEAIEIEPIAFEVCVKNFENSPWLDSLFCYHASLKEFLKEVDDQFDLVVCNPPFYSGKIQAMVSPRDLARKQAAMPLLELLFSVSRLLTNDGNFCVVLPKNQENILTQLGLNFGLYIHEICDIQGNPDAAISRILVLMKKTKCITLKKSSLIIEYQRGEWTNDYINLTKDFYIGL